MEAMRKHFESVVCRLIRFNALVITAALLIVPTGVLTSDAVAQETQPPVMQSDTTDAAVPQQQQAASADTASIAQTYTSGVEQLKSGNTQGAVTSFEEILRRDPTHVESMINLTRAYLDLEQVDKARNTIEGAITADSANAEAYLVRGRVMQSTGDMEEAISSYRNSIDLDEENPFAYNNLALIYIQDGRYSEAIPLLEKAIGQKNDIAYFHNNLGIAYEGMGNLADAEAAFQQTLNIDPGYEKAASNLERVQGSLVQEGANGSGAESTRDSTTAIKR